MAGSMNHVIENGRYLGVRLIENRRDDIETIDELVFVLLTTTTEAQRKTASEYFFRCLRNEEPWPYYMGPNGRG